MSSGIYLHIPFCQSKCPYCDFYSGAGSEGDYDAYTDALVRALETAPPLDAPPNTLYLGGGTPSLLGAARLLRLLEAARRSFGVAFEEATLEANPGTVDLPLLTALRRGGFTRLSFGVQSLDAGILRQLGRRHTADEARLALAMGREAGFDHLSADLMLALPGQTPEMVECDVGALAATGIDHLSAYLLKLEPGTPAQAAWAEPDEDASADCYLAAVAACEANGLHQYEISNFAADEAAQSRHNLHYWRCRPYLGVGAAAHSFLGGRRFYFPRDRAAFCAAANPWTLTVDDGPGGDADERLLLGLRLTEGIALDRLPDGEAELLRRAAPFLEAGLLRRESGRLALTPQGFLLSNTIIAALL